MKFWLELGIGCLAILLAISSSLFAERAQSARQMLALLGVDDSELAMFIDNEPVSDDELELIRRILYQIQRFDEVDVRRLTRPQTVLPEILATPKPHRAELVSFTGQLTSIQSIPLTPNQAKRFRFSSLYRATIEPSPGADSTGTQGSPSNPIIVYTRQIPAAWRSHSASPVKLSVSLDGLFLKTTTQTDRNGRRVQAEQSLVFVANRIAWHPAANDSMAASSGYQHLARLGMDVGLFDELQHRKKLTAEDRECFYRMLYAVSKDTVPDNVRFELLKDARRDFSIVSLLQEPAQESGKIYQFVGNVRRAIKIRVNDADIRERFGIDHYFEVEMFLPLPQQLLLVDPDTNEKIAFNDYPLVFCFSELPDGLEEGTVNQSVRLTGFYLKLWSYENQRLNASTSDDIGEAKLPKRRLQNAPLLIGIAGEVLSSSGRHSPLPGILGGLAFVIGLGLIVFGLQGQRNRDREFKTRRAIQEPDVDLEHLP